MNFFSRRDFVKGSLVSAVAAATAKVGAAADVGADGKLKPARVLIDMVHNNPGDAPFVTHYNDPAFVAQLGCNGKVYELFEGAQFGIDWSSIDPDIFPVGSPERAWVDKKAADLDTMYTAAKKAGLRVYCHTDMVVFPKRLVEKYQMKHFGDISDPQTQRFLRAAVQQMFTRFPQLDGLVIRIGETYLQGAPYHTGAIMNKTDPDKTIIPLMNLLREEVCVGMQNKNILFRSWYSFDTSVPAYLAVSNGVEPHPNLLISVKHVEGDFHRGNPFSKVLGMGRHGQVVEVECQREYEGKGAYPNYIAHGVIEGFEEHNGQSIRKTWASPLLVGMFTWSRGGGWKGPYITNELWCDVNVYVLAQWAQHPNRSEAEVFDDYSAKVLKLNADDRPKFRQLCLLSADAVYRGKTSTHHDISPWWSRDWFMNAPPVAGSPAAEARVLAEKDEAVGMWNTIVSLAESIRFPDAATKEYAVTSAYYGLYLYSIYRDGFKLAGLGVKGDKDQIRALIGDYDATWAKFRQLKETHPSCATLYTDTDFRQPPQPGGPGIGAMVDKFRAAVGSQAI